ncbi:MULTISPECIES: dihydroneopterin triphosphate diphosphatase [Snodgrassella]|uniref:NTP pyrophosphohydrolase including oxidative damage repair enzyme n=1 Tax=Snodgrassella alvi SCGC AB-598-J21 TaxID=1385367 RepID=A0A074V5D7_9NEIS|nr:MULTISPECIES: dihydroneopterin triphosphate diphosphatase [Snodgrassella]KEQ00371.1 NTP pyrophosphohydrolase including oxidative damage repair enzyme [Snodgrassella alvi SCGC AB-598-J21]MBI0096684.1 dihydroneopterin triphosphate diphosphatase [Snodgrassella sp. W8134]MBI0101581.1 dihydroneopterin triphosphate diphosphatase [Snodgrassella sp. W8135]MCT6884056.1 dihydroneopterin triphosphate diphosphatase [Snodgrassella alvi]NUE80375.1 dihydroneopterin triphosphate diphosphatase [Snodgrassell
MINNKPYKQPVSVLVVIYDNNRQILLLERADKPDFWQSVTGSLEPGETIEQTAKRELAEETGIYSNDILNWQQSTIYEIYPHWRHRYAPGVTHNTEHIFSLCVTAETPILLSPREHLDYIWCSPEQAAEKVFSPSNRSAILQLPQHW